VGTGKEEAKQGAARAAVVSSICKIESARAFIAEANEL
jgi:hypothetical protein